MTTASSSSSSSARTSSCQLVQTKQAGYTQHTHTHIYREKDSEKGRKSGRGRGTVANAFRQRDKLTDNLAVNCASRRSFGGCSLIRSLSPPLYRPLSLALCRWSLCVVYCGALARCSTTLGNHRKHLGINLPRPVCVCACASSKCKMYSGHSLRQMCLLKGKAIVYRH